MEKPGFSRILKPWHWRWPCFPKAALVDEIFSLLQSLAALSEFKKEVVVLAAIYIERLLARHSSLRLLSSNWRPLLIAALHLASKTWEDVHAWNAEFAAYLRWSTKLRYTARSLHILELRFLAGLEYQMEVCGELYASYYFALVEADYAPPQRSTSKEEPVSWANVYQRSQSCEASTVGGSLLGPRTRGPSDLDSPESSSSASSRWRVSRGRTGSVLSTAPDPWLSSHSTVATATGSDLNRVASSTACCSAGNDLNASFCEFWQDTNFWKFQHLMRLEKLNPYVGFFRHAPRALPPSPHIRCRSMDDMASSVHRGRLQGRKEVMLKRRTSL